MEWTQYQCLASRAWSLHTALMVRVQYFILLKSRRSIKAHVVLASKIYAELPDMIEFVMCFYCITIIAKVLHCCLNVSILTSHQESSLHVQYTETEVDVRSLSGQTRKYQKRNEKGGKKKINMIHHQIECIHCRWKVIFHEEQLSINCEEVWRKYSVVRSLPPNRRYHCPCCGVLLMESDLVQHEGHGTRSGVTDEQLLEPTGLVTPKDNKKSQAVRRRINCLICCAT